MSYLENALKMRPYIEKAAASLSDADALQVPTLFPPWKSGTDYKKDDRVEHGGILYRCIQAHTALDNWTPDQTPAMWVRVSLEEWPEWVQPLGRRTPTQKELRLHTAASGGPPTWMPTCGSLACTAGRRYRDG